jgi:4-hydroxy-tetrahydrodipicolinate reductase
MGGEILALARESGFVVTCGVANAFDGNVGGVPAYSHPNKLEPDDIDLVIDFSLPELTPDVVRWCSESGKALVCGVTGLNDTTHSLIKIAKDTIPILWAPNMSLGIAVVSRMLRALASLNQHEFQIEEFHHKHKKDKPSGTALLLQEKLKAAVGNVDVPEPVAIRGGGIFGVHKVWAMGEEETVMIEHTAMNRRVFARGALRAANWLLPRPPGLYTIDDIL